MTLLNKQCVPCKGGVPPLTLADAKQLNTQVPEWQLADDAHDIRRRFQFKNFVSAMTFVQEVGNLAEQEGHHPDITFGWGYAEVMFYTHKIKGLHENDFIMAAKVDELFD